MRTRCYNPNVRGFTRNYEPSNCVWASRTVQNRNTRKTLYITYQGERKPLRVWAELKGIKPCTLERRLKAGYAENEIFRPLQFGVVGGIYARGL